MNETAAPVESAPAQDATEAFGARTPWTAGAAAMFAIITVTGAILAAKFSQPLHEGFGLWLGQARGPDGRSAGILVNAMLTLIIMQVVIVAMVWWGAARFGGDRVRLLSLQAHLPTRSFLIGLAGMVVLLVPYNLAIYFIRPEEFAADLRPFWDLARSPFMWLGAIAMVIGAPLAEELLFRGFLLPAMTKTKYGFRGAALMTTAGWTALHVYSLAGLIEVFAIGLWFAWLMWRFGNLWVPMSLHAVYNGLQLLVLAMLPPS